MSFAKKLLHVIIAAAMMLTVIPAVGFNAYATEVTEITATMTGNPADICQLGNPTSNLPSFSLQSPDEVILGTPEWNLNGDTTSASTFIPGIWTLWIPVYIDTTAHPSDTLSPTVKLTVNGTEWELDHINPGDSDDPDPVAWFVYPAEFDLTISGVLNFNKERGWDIRKPQVGVPVSVDVHTGVTGGTPSYFFTKESGPDWLTVDPDSGVVSGTPYQPGDNDDLVIKVSDAKSDSAEITLFVGQTIGVDNRTPLTELKMSAPKAVEDIAQYGKTLAKLGIKTNSYGHLKEFPTEEYWEKWDESTNQWNKVDFESVFTSGEYRYHIKVEVKDEDKPAYALQTPSMKEETAFNTWTLGDWSVYDGTAEFTSQSVTIEETINKLTFKGISVPLDDAIPSKEYTLDEEHVTVSKDDSHWYVENSDGTWALCDDIPFNTANKYKIEFKCNTESGYAFADPTYVTINTMNATVNRMNDHELLAECIIPPAAVKDAWYVVTAGSLNVRDTASYAGNRVGGLKYGDVVRSVGVSGKWIMIEFNGESAWICGDYAALTYSEETAIKPVNATINVGAVNVREEPDTESTRIGGFSGSKVVLVTGELTNSKNEKWLVVDYDGQLGFIKATYTDYTSAEEDQDQTDLIIYTGGVPAKITLEACKSAVAYKTDANITQDHMNCIGDEAVEVDIYPDDGENFTTLTVEKISLPDDPAYMVASMMLNSDGSVHLRLIPKNSASVTFDTDGGTEVKERTVTKGNTVAKPEDPVKEGCTFDAWYADESFTSAFDFSAPLNADAKAYARFMNNINGIKAHISGTEKDSDGKYRPKADQLEAVFEKDTADVTVTVSPLYTDNSLGTALDKEPEPGKDYWFTLTMECKGGDKPECFYMDSIKTAGVFEGDDAVIEAVSFEHKAGSAIYTVTLKYTGIGYIFSKGADGTWQKGSSAGFEFTVNRTAEDDKTFSLFTGIEVDGKALTASDYEASAGSLNAVIKSAYLNTLAEGSHTIKVNFRDGSVETTVTVDPSKKTETSQNTTGNTSGAPKTGDERKPAVWGTVAGISLVAIAALAFVVIRSKKKDKK